MKIITLTIITLISTVILKGQNLEVGTYLELTHISPKFGTAIGYTFQDRGEVGFFYQRAAKLARQESNHPLRSENQFYGAYFAYPLMAKRLVCLKFKVRTGISNGENFVITPSVQAAFSLTKSLSVGGGVGTRSFRPTYLASLTIKLCNQTSRMR